MAIRIEGLSKLSHGRTVLERLSLEIRSGEFLVLLGPPGSGRAALLRLLAGLDQPDSGQIFLDGTDITRLPMRRRGIGYVYQHDPLFGHPTVFEAVLAAIPAEPGTLPPGAEEAAALAHRLLDLVGLGDDAGWLPATLPPPQRHRLALARALAAGPCVLLLGEAFGTLDPERRAAPRRWLRALHEGLGLTTVLVAQDVAHALAVADRIAVLWDGRVEQVGTPDELRRSPASRFVAELVGLPVTPPAGGVRGYDLGPASAAALLPQDLEVVELGSGTPAKVLGSRVRGLALRIELQLLSDGSQIEAEMPGLGMASLPPVGTLVGVRMRRMQGLGGMH